MVMIVVSVLLSTINCIVVRGEGIAPEIALVKSVIINQQLEGIFVWLIFCITHML